MATTPSIATIAQAAMVVKVLPLTVAEVTVSPNGLTIRKRCPACGGWIVAENTPQAWSWIAARNRVCRPCDEDMRVNGLAWTPEADNLQADFSPTAAWQEYRQEFCEEAQR